MKKKYSVLWSNSAENDLINIIEYIANDSPTSALKIFEKIKKKSADLHYLPQKGRIVPEL